MKRFFIDTLRVWFAEFTTVFRDKGILIFILFVPLAYPLLYSFVYTNEVVREVPVAVVDDSHSSLSRDFIRKIDATPDVSLYARPGSMSEARELMKRQKVYGIIHIPASLTKDIAEHRQTNIGLYCDMSSMLYYKNLLLAATNVSLELNKLIKVSEYLSSTTDEQAAVTATPIEYTQVALYNPASGFASFLIPPVLMLIIQQTILLGIGMSAGDTRERTEGSLVPQAWRKRGVLPIMAGKTLLYFLLYLLIGVYMFTFVTHAFGLPQLGEYSTFIAFLTPYLLACISMAIVFSCLVYRREDCIMLFVFLSVPMLFLSGLSWPGSTMPHFWKCVSWIFPSTFGMNGYVAIRGMNASLADIRYDYIALWVQAGVYFLVSAVLYLRSMRGGQASGGVRPSVAA